jgi:hypothetical protein
MLVKSTAGLGKDIKIYLMADHDHGLLSIVALQETFLEVMAFSWNPDRLLGVIRTEHVLTLLLHGDNQVGERIWIWLPRLSQFYMARHLGEGSKELKRNLNSEKLNIIQLRFKQLRCKGGGKMGQSPRFSSPEKCYM